MKRNKRTSVLILSILTIILFANCTGSPGDTKSAGNKSDAGLNATDARQQKVPANNNKTGNTSYKVTFIELGSVRCIPCQQMQPIMKSIREKYSTQVNVVFHDVWTEAGAPYGKSTELKLSPHRYFSMKPGKSISGM